MKGYQHLFFNLFYRIHRGNQSFTVPITLANEIMPSAVFYGTVTPIIAYYVFKRLVIDPYKKEKEERLVVIFFVNAFEYWIVSIGFV